MAVALRQLADGRAPRYMYEVYVLYNKKNYKFYIGQTIDLAERLLLHRNKFFKNSYTSRFDGTWNVVYKEQFVTRTESLKREKQLKSFRGREFIKKTVLKI